jgi:DNA-directed RNA polymerase specialized sigma24 family protein
MRAAFHELHGRSLHGFALLLLLGDQAQAARLSGEALGMGLDHVDELRHPERAAAWLRARLVQSALALRASDLQPTAGALTGLGADPAVVAALGVLDTRERAALIASFIEHLDPRDVAAVLRRDGSRLRHLVMTARRKYLAAYLGAAPEVTVAGPIADRLHDVAQRTIG